jgi:hypothetical protein
MRVWWFRVITDLQHEGVTIRSQASELGVSIGAIQGWKAGSEPGWHHGQRLIQLYVTRTGNTQLPYEATMYST